MCMVPLRLLRRWYRVGVAGLALLCLAITGVRGASRTPGGAYLVKDILPGGGSSDPRGLVDVDGTLFFVAYEPLHGWELWRSDGTGDGTVLVTDAHPDRSRGGGGRGVAQAGTPGSLHRVGGRLFYAGDDGIHGLEPWVSDGTEAGTRMVVDMNPGRDSSLDLDTPIVDLNGTAVFPALEPIHGRELWRSDGSVMGTRLVKDMDPGADGGFVRTPRPQVRKGLVFFTGDDGATGFEPWRSDGTEAGTFLLRDLNPSRYSEYVAGGSSVQPDGFVLHEPSGLVCFIASWWSASGGRQIALWRTDGTSSGTQLVYQLPAKPSSPHLGVGIGGPLFLIMEDPVTGEEPWVTDGTREGTRLLLDINPGPQGSTPGWPFSLGSFVLFSAFDGVRSSMWRSDGTAAGTFAAYEAPLGGVIMVEGRAYLVVWSSDRYSCQFWETDGTERGTRWVADLQGQCPPYLSNFISSGGRLFWTVFTREFGSELWALDLSRR